MCRVTIETDKQIVPIRALLGSLAIWLLIPAFSLVNRALAQTGCSTVYPLLNGWAIDMCTSDARVAAPMQVLLDGDLRGEAVLVRVSHKSTQYSSVPQVAIFYSSGFLRLKPNADPSPPIPFGSSFVLGPAYWPDESTYHHNPQLNRLEIDTSKLPNGPLQMRAKGSNGVFEVAYKMALPPPRDRQTRLHVIQSYRATAATPIDSIRRTEHQGFKLVQISSMYINEGGPCEGNKTDCHDSNAVRYINQDLVRREVSFSSLTIPGLFFAEPQPLGSTWLDVLHTDDRGWQGNTPNVRIALDALPPKRTMTAQGYIAETANPNEDNVSLWLHDDGEASQGWEADQTGEISYWLLAQDNPPEPWDDLALRPGFNFLSFEGSYSCRVQADGATGSVVPIAGYADTALELKYDLKENDGNWARIRCDFNPPLDLSAYDHLRLDWRGSSGVGDPPRGNSLEVGLVNFVGGGQREFFGPPHSAYRNVTQRTWWEQLIIPFSMFATRVPERSFDFDPTNVSVVFVSVVKLPKCPKDECPADVGGPGSIAVDNLSAFSALSRETSDSLEAVTGNATASRAAAEWLTDQQQNAGLLKSWQDEEACKANTYEQALALIVFAKEKMWPEADALVEALVRIQNSDGSWFQSRECDDLGRDMLYKGEGRKWEGDIAWTVYALSRYRAMGGQHPEALSAQHKGAQWLAGLLNDIDGCLRLGGTAAQNPESTEGTIDIWWALQAAGPEFASQAAGLKNCLLVNYWDEQMGRMKNGRSDPYLSWHPLLDNQTWGAAFLKAIGEEEKARRAISYAWQTMRLPAQGGQLFGFDGQAGPWSVWNEGAGQYVAVGGEGAEELLGELLAQQRGDGAMPGAPDFFQGAGVWTPRWHGVAPTAWLYNALNEEPFVATMTSVSAASFLPGGVLAPESIVGGFGSRLATTTEAAATIPLPTFLAGTTISVKDSAGAMRLAPLFFVSPGQINYLIPKDTKLGLATLSVTSGGQVVATGTLQIDAVSPGLFAANSDGRGVTAAVAVRAKPDGSQSWQYVFSPDAPVGSRTAVPIDLGPAGDQVFLLLYGTGIRGRSSLSAVSAKIGGVDAPVDYAGPAPGFVGLDQVNVRVPRELGGRGEVYIVLAVDGEIANVVTASIK